MREKYIEECFPRYFIFGEAQHCVDIASSKNHTIATVSRKDAENLIKDREKVIDMLCLVTLEFAKVAPEEFTKFWYPKDKASAWWNFE